MLLTAWRAFLRWRAGRPFGAGLLVTAAALVILFPPFANVRLGDVVISIRTIGGVSALLIGVLLLICACSLWLRPQFRLPAGAMAVVLSLVALVTTNLGGFLLGSVLGLLGGALAVAWTDQPRTPVAGVAVIALLLLQPGHAAVTREWTLTASRLDIEGLRYTGIVDSVVDGRVVKVLRFTASVLRARDLVQTGDLGNGAKIVTRAAPGAVSTVSRGRIELLVVRLRANLNVLGVKIPVDYSANSPPPLIVPFVIFTEVTVRATDLKGGVLHVPGAAISVT
ncbi:DUF6114 domain-containing protein [Lentzea tibetensis]|uniref:DUF6114 domain-containing protein n=1 Tax=Lentzea tibetensis TaxID=2591470 RepID=UPI001648ED85|nr:DUF6114 domain-containing protein [Lentzea tibetensis]